MGGLREALDTLLLRDDMAPGAAGWQKLGTPPTKSTLSAAGPNPNFADGSAMSQSQRAGAEPELEQQRGGGEAAVAAAAAACIGLQGMQHLQRGNVSSLRCHGAYA